jgi:hypothetical protein
VALPDLVEHPEEDDDLPTSPWPGPGHTDSWSGDEKEGNKATPGMDRPSSSSTDWVKGERGKRAFAFLQEVVVLNGLEERDLSSYANRGGRPRVRALSDWYEWGIAPLQKSPAQIAQDLHPEKSLASLLRTLKANGLKVYRARELVSQAALFYENFFGIKDTGKNGVLAAILAEWPTTTVRAKQRYTEPMPIGLVLDWLDKGPDNEELDRFDLYRKLMVSIQLSCIARTADIFRLRFDTLARSDPKGPVTLVTSLKTSKQNGFRFFLFPIPDNPRRCPVRTILDFQKKWNAELTKKRWKLPTGFIHVYRSGKPMTRPDQLAQVLKGVYTEAGVDVKHWGPNGARHAVITYYLASGIKEKQIKLITGHSMRSSTTQDYYTLPLQDWATRSILAVNPIESRLDLPTPQVLGRAEELLATWDDEEVIVELNPRPTRLDIPSNAVFNVTDRSLISETGQINDKDGTPESQ